MYRVLPCSSRMGISARALLRKSTDGKPDFKDIYEENNDAYDKLLGTAIPEKKLEQYPLTDWREDISKELKESKLELAVTCLTKEIVMKERSHVLSRENKQLIVEIKKLIYDQRRLILAMGRSTQELDDAYRAFNNISSKMKQVLQKWDTEESRIKSESTYVFQRAFKVLEAQALDVAMQAIENTLHEFPWREKAEQLEDANDLVFQRKSDIEAFLVSVQQEMRMLLAPIKRNFVTSVRQLANQSHTKLFDSLKATIQGSIVVNGQSELIEDIADQLTPHDYEIGLLSTISDKVVHAVVSGRHTNVGYFNDISNANASDRARDVGQLGFMLRAPAAVLATISQLSVDLWRFIQRSKTYVLSKGALSKELQCHVIRPYFEDLRKEGHCTLNDTIMKSSQVARQRVEFSLQEEKRRFSQEKERRSAQEQELEVLTPAIGSVAPSMDLATSSMAILVNLLAAQTGLLRLQEHLEDVTLCINN
ncbi:hypothetical protein PILCRDRAFT_133027 [Piloderma croceum F 1598]|uniref:Uncharacterized protein n=1 Tax=Piloderma croceum (strain F 1598) TaxID=765440 RepID=A0A0C3CPA2_PILCF|nr:hypothetical protein PILCRDRAFT_133027 [Piloderma croceum F 1598]